MKIKKGNVNAQWLSKQSYLYRLGYVWLNTAMTKDGRGASLNPLKMTVIDVFWVLYCCAISLLFLPVFSIASFISAFNYGRPKERIFFDEPTTNYNYTDSYYFYMETSK